MKYYIYRNDRQEGPYEAQTIINMRLSNDTYVWNETMSDWQPISSVLELQPQVPAAPAYQPSYQQPSYQQPSYGPQPNYGPQPAYGSQPAYAQGPSSGYPCPSTHMALAIITTIMCCLPTGIVAIMKSSKVESLYHSGYYDEAVEASKSSMNWSIAGIVISLIAWLAYVLLIFVGAISMASYY